MFDTFIVKTYFSMAMLELSVANLLNRSFLNFLRMYWSGELPRVIYFNLAQECLDDESFSDLLKYLLEHGYINDFDRGRLLVMAMVSGNEIACQYIFEYCDKFE